MAEARAVPEEQSDKKQGDKLDHAVGSALDKVTGPTQDAAGEGTTPTPQSGSLK